MPEGTPRFFLITPPLADAQAFAAPLAAALDAADVACLLARTSTRDPGEAKKIVRALAPIVQGRDVALLVAGDAQLATRAGADGCHVDLRGAEGGDALAEAVAALKPERIVGAGGLDGRDAAMSAGEAGVDYVMFGGPDDPLSADAILEQVGWWAEIFNVPCVGYAASLAEVGLLAAAGADFVALADAAFGDPRGPAAALAEAAASLADA